MRRVGVLVGLAAALACHSLAGCGGDSASSGENSLAADGTKGGRCYPNSTCNSGLVCFSNNTCGDPGTGGSGGVGPDGGLDADAGQAGGAGEDADGATPLEDDSELQGGYAPSGNEGPIDPGGSGSCVGPASELKLAVPWIPQVPPGSWDKTMNCGPTSYLMIDSFYRAVTPTSFGIKAIDDWMAANITGWSLNNYNGDPQGSNTGEISRVATEYGTYPGSTKFSGATCENLKAELQAGRPVIVVIDTQTKNNHPSTTMKPSGHGHFAVLGGMDKEYVYLFDPGRSVAVQGCGENCQGRRFTLDSFYEIWSKHGRTGNYILKEKGDCSCGNGVCETQAGCAETCATCEPDCACAACQNCSGSGACVPKAPNCGSKQCGVDSCGNSCGDCPVDSSCDTQTGQCVYSCQGGCSTPPNSCYSATGSCVNDTCQYAPKNAGVGCDDGNACTTNDVCNGSGTCAGTGLACTTPPGPCYSASGTCSGGTCNYAPKGAGTACDDGNTCTTGDSCNGSGLCVGSGMNCVTPPNECYDLQGSCSNGTCSYSPKSAGAACNDANACTVNDACNGSGTCTGTAMSCSTPPNTQCYNSVGVCTAGSCSYTPKSSGTACNDNSACTSNDVCNGNGTCAGTGSCEVCNGVDDDGNGIVDDPSSCWKAVYRFVQTSTGARCWGPSSSTPPTGCSGYTYELEAFIVAANQVPNTYEARQCSKLTDHIIVPYGSNDYNALVSSGHDCSVSLGYFFNLGTAPASGHTPWANTCPLYRFSYSASGNGAHLFTRGADTVTGMSCEAPARADVFTNFGCFPSKPSGC